MNNDQLKVAIEVLKEKFNQIANARVAKWERLGNRGMIERAKADAVTSYGILCDAIDSLFTAAQSAGKDERASLAKEQEQKPVAWMLEPNEKAHKDLKRDVSFSRPIDRPDWTVTPLYAAPQAQQDYLIQRYEDLKLRKRELETEVSDLRNTLKAMQAQQEAGKYADFWKRLAEAYYGQLTYPDHPELGEGALDAYFEKIMGTHVQSDTQQSNPGWQRITKSGQVKVGDKLRFTICDDKYNETAKVILYPGTDKEEIIYNKRKNYYLITSMAIENKGSQKNVECLAQQRKGSEE